MVNKLQDPWVSLFAHFPGGQGKLKILCMFSAFKIRDYSRFWVVFFNRNYEAPSIHSIKDGFCQMEIFEI